MKLKDAISKYKNKVFNALIIMLALIITQNIYKSQARVRHSLKTKAEAQIKKNEILDSISKLEREINSYKEMFGKKEASSVINTISGIAKDSDVRVISIKPQFERNYPVYVKYSYSLVVNASNYHRLGKFVSKIESSEDSYIIDSFNIKSYYQQQEGPIMAVTAELTLSTIFFKG